MDLHTFRQIKIYDFNYYIHEKLPIIDLYSQINLKTLISIINPQIITKFNFNHHIFFKKYTRYKNKFEIQVLSHVYNH